MLDVSFIISCRLLCVHTTRAMTSSMSMLSSPFLLYIFNIFLYAPKNHFWLYRQLQSQHKHCIKFTCNDPRIYEPSTQLTFLSVQWNLLCHDRQNSGKQTFVKIIRDENHMIIVSLPYCSYCYLYLALAFPTIL